MQSKVQKRLVLIVIASIFIIVSGIVYINKKGDYKEESGQKVNFHLPGGCSGTSMIKNLKVEPKNSCLIISANNCNGGTLDIINNCSQNVKIGNLNIPQKYVGIELKKDSAGKITADYSNGNYAAYEPSKNEDIGVSGNIGNEKFTIDYLKAVNQSRENMY